MGRERSGDGDVAVMGCDMREVVDRRLDEREGAVV